jgi:predicted YcjX-like family ATPase
LPENKSIEDVAVVLKVLKSAIKTVVRNLISGGERVLVEKLDIDKSVEIINFQKDKTLGRFIDETTKLWFEPNAKISKFSIALEYENQSTDESVNPNSKNEISVIKKLLNLRGEKSAESGVFDEVE